MPRPKKGFEKQKTRPQKPIDWGVVDNFLIAGCYGTEIAGFFSMHCDTFYDRVKLEKGIGFTDYMSEKRNHGKSILRAKQFEKAMKGSDKMLIHCGKHLLDQHDKIKQDITSTQNITQRSILELPDNGRRIASNNDNTNNTHD